MEKIIRDIIDADREARERIERVALERYNIEALIKKQKEIIIAKYSDELTAKVTKQKALYDSKLALQKEYNEKEYEKSLSSLQQQFDTCREDWTNIILQHCLEK